MSGHLFIGGCIDGQWKDVQSNVNTVRAAARAAQPTVNAPDHTVESHIRVDMYRRMPWATDGYNADIFVEMRISGPDALDMLLKGYKRP